ncbi:MULTISPECIES: aspartate--tRNA(Asn) ligase [unclassified Oceanispirochaeta]|uniref:aspartate--tRNA(Asn) ligase n=1 Tax=unclassified Oceanispirochaeta TaxID=2635722 RepID=UPI000E095FF6|nr:MULTISPECIES: aspartate--tRNA(Asn) ligase [unclassified Oceanispirochaeta]MBF9016261.1 aspartate--tRNA(Asn) ligase [Oceanispirochaeta sp. M2]NPD72723.1 aspartate--tRNA(Asn) ligase [Oceanispirochaeta sp. M1]RDG31870.1 aspartate--tRNA(Asn) ligase [Oceanispirochaeta sp. M1]
MRILAKDIKDHAGKEITVSGWVHRIRELGGVNFIIFRDRSGQIQLVTNEEVNLTLESVISATGTVHENDKAPGGYELQLTAIDVLAPAAPDLPFPVNQDPAKIGLETILDNRSISLRNPKILSIFRLQADIMRYFGEYLRGLDFTEIKSTKLVGGATEGGTNLFRVEYFDTTVCLAQSPQVYKQTMVSSGLERVFEISHAYRAEKHETSRHINEYVSLDVEMAFIEDEMELIELERGAIKYIFSQVKANNQKQLDDWGATVPEPELCDKIPVITHEKCKKIVSERIGRRVFEINPEAEVVISEWAMENYGVDLVFINEFPRKKRPFYTYPKGLKTMSFDLVFRGLEITTGGRRINEYKMFQEALPKFGLTEGELGAYASIFKYGCPPHGGFAIGLERLTQKILGLANVKEASLFPRDRKRITP